MRRANEKGTREWLAYNKAGDVLTRKRIQRATLEVDEGFDSFASRCVERLGQRFTVEHVDYIAEKPRILARHEIDLKDRFSTALGEPPAAMFAVFFKMSAGSAAKWCCKSDKNKPKALKKWLERQNE